MLPFISIGIGAGLVSALLTLSILAGSAMAVALVWLAPLPLMIAGLGWHWLSAALGACVGALAISIGFNGATAVNFFAATGVPAAGLTFLAAAGLLERREGPYPARPGLLTLAAALYSILLALGIMLFIDTSLDDAQALLARQFERLLRAMLQLPAEGPLVFGSGQDLSGLPKTFAQLFPSLMAAMAALGMLFNLWLAGRVVRKSGRLTAGWPFLPALRLPRLAAALAAAGMLLSFLGGYAGLAGSLLIEAMAIAFALQGFAVLHFVTQGRNGRGFMLFLAWFTTIVFGLPGLLMAALGLADHVFDFRKLKLTPQS